MATAFDPVKYLTDLEMWIVGAPNPIAPELGLPPERRTRDVLEAARHVAAAQSCFMQEVVLAEQAREAAIRAAAAQARQADVRAELERHAGVWNLRVPAWPGEPRAAWVIRLADHPVWHEHELWERERRPCHVPRAGL
jgi:hypothetical protein